LPDSLCFLTFGVSIIHKKFLLEHGNLVGKNPHFQEVNGIESVDIDTELDFKFAEDLYLQTQKIQKPKSTNPIMPEDEYFHGHGY